ncbi:MAG TPA: hypothetical protein O0X19_04995 [Methanocorpusculum sp.]|nr:hypothetical protein [Candidatus Methanocorpusculum equi]HJJ33714.1 hypothetical protein [Methanocorpusculum sp.]HJJ45244.1 hypothetical protein [Methanocorpusculum sp.]HJJ58894.1 hypothetical protein [Methanocorpusculum sp.]
MAKPIQLGLVLEGDDAREFEEYMENPVFPEHGIESMCRVLSRRKARGLE